MEIEKLTKEIDELTKDGIQEITIEKQTKEPLSSLLYLQILDVKYETKFINAKLSDGYNKVDAFFDLDAEKLLRSMTPLSNQQLILNCFQATKPIIKINNFVSQPSNSSNIIVITDFETAIADQIQEVGRPIEFSDSGRNSSINNEGSNLIRKQTKQELPSPPIAKRRIVDQAVCNFSSCKNELYKTPFHPIINAKSQKPKVRLTNCYTKPKQFIKRVTQENKSTYTPISLLFPSMQGWTIKARVTSKSERRVFHDKSKNTQKEYFTVDILDDEGTAINCTFFNEACIKFFNRLESNKVYEFSKGNIKENRLSKGNQAKCQIDFEHFLPIEAIQEVKDDNKIQQNIFNITKLKVVENLNIGDLIDILVVVNENSQSLPISLKTGQMRAKRCFFVFDDTAKIEVTFWDSYAENFNLQKDQIICLKALRVNEFLKTKNLKSTPTTAIVEDPNKLIEIEGYTAFRDWYTENRDKIQQKEVESKTFTTALKQVSLIESEAQENIQNAQYKRFSEVRAFLMFINTKNTPTYPGCINCPKKLTFDYNTRKNYCETCSMDVDQPSHKFILNVQLVDGSGCLWAKFYDEQSQSLLNMTASTFVEMEEEAKYKTLRSCYNRERRMLVLTKVESYNNQSRIRHQVIRFLEDNYQRETSDLLSQLKQFEQE